MRTELEIRPAVSVNTQPGDSGHLGIRLAQTLGLGNLTVSALVCRCVCRRAPSFSDRERLSEIPTELANPTGVLPHLPPAEFLSQKLGVKPWD